MKSKHKRSITKPIITRSGRNAGRERQEWMEAGLAGVGADTLLDHCKERGVCQVSHQLQP